MIRVLEQAGFRVMGLASPIGATRAILENGVRVVVIDIMMPGMRGDRLAALFRGNPRLRELGVVLVSGASAAELLSLSVESGANAVVSKANLHELVPVVRRALRRRDSVPGMTYG
ncbi:MAG: response regulator [Myxococcales bacterium]|nr:MAG: response regulator [Myxococcales bacterium]